MSDEATPALRIWVVDDDPDLRQLLGEVLGQQGYEVRCLNDGGQLLTWLQRQRPDLVVLDLMLPGDDGLKLLRQLRDAGDDLPVLMLTARADGVDRIIGLEQRRVRPIGLTRAIANLADNAISHGRPPLRIELKAIGDQGFLIHVADCGEGIAPGLWTQAIEPFQRLDPARGNNGHCGLGLAIVERLARAHGGRLSCRSLVPNPGQPQRFAVELTGWSQLVTSTARAVIPQSHKSSRLYLSPESQAR